jgi:hypothetical protein
VESVTFVTILWTMSPIRGRSHFDVLVWLQGDIQRYLPHDIMVASWGDFDTGSVHHDIISRLEGVRSLDANAAKLTPLMQRLRNGLVPPSRRPDVQACAK